MTVAVGADVGIEPTTPLALPAIEASEIVVAFGDQVALRGVSLAVQPGERVALVGPNGAGKTTLLRVMAGLARPDAGTVSLAGHPLHPRRADLRALLGVVLHHSFAYPELTLRENLDFFARLYRVPDRGERIPRVLDLVGLQHRSTQRVAALSRGMVQRLAIARAILHDPPILLLDEPDTGLDQEAMALLEAILNSHRSDGARTVQRRSTLFTTHAFEHARRLADRTLIMHEGRLVEHVGAVAAGPRVTGDRYDTRAAQSVANARAPSASV